LNSIYKVVNKFRELTIGVNLLVNPPVRYSIKDTDAFEKYTHNNKH